MITLTSKKHIDRNIVIILLTIAIIYFIRGLYTVYYSDDLLYSLYLTKEAAKFGSDFTPTYFSNIFEIVPSQWNHYLYTNGRAICHIFVQLFNAFLPQWCYALMLALCNVLLVYLCVAILNNQHKFKSYLFAFIFTWIAFPQYIIPCIGFGYTFSAVLVLIWLYIYKCLYRNNTLISNKKIILMFLFSIICGSTNESLTIGIAGTGILYFILNYKTISLNERILLLGFLIGFCILCFAPGSLRRFLGHSKNTFDINILLSNKLNALFLIFKNLNIFYIWLLLFFYTQKNRYLNYIKDNIYYITPIFITFCFTLALGYINARQLYLIELFSIILSINLLMQIKINKLITCVSTIILYLHILFVTIFTVKLYKYNKYIVNQYIKSETGIVLINKVNIPQFIIKYVDEIKSYCDDPWFTYCLKKYYNKDTNLTIIH